MNYNPESEREAYQRHLAEKDAERFYDAANNMNGQLEKMYEREAELHEQLAASQSRERVYRETLEAAQSHLAKWIVPNSGISDGDVLNQLLSVLDNQDLVRTMRATTPKLDEMEKK